MWENILKKEIYINWMTPEKRMGWVEGHGPYEDVSIRAYMKDNPDIKFIETISTTYKGDN
jgi:hypothetical protein